MKKTILIFLNIILFISIQKFAIAQEKNNTKIILDSLEILKKAGGYVDGYNNPPTPEEIRFYNITQMFYNLQYPELKKLMIDKNPISRTYGFSVITKKYFDSLSKNDLNILDDTTPLPMYLRGEIINGYFTIGRYCTMAYNSTLSDRSEMNKKQTIVAAVELFIKNNAQFPNTYKPVEFLKYSWSEGDNKTMYEIQHHYKLKNKEGKIVEASNFFIFNQNFEINIIEKVRSNIISVSEPDIKEWLEEFGNK